MPASVALTSTPTGAWPNTPDEGGSADNQDATCSAFTPLGKRTR